MKKQKIVLYSDKQQQQYKQYEWTNSHPNKQKQMGESQYSASQMSASTRSFATLDQSLVTQGPLKLFMKLLPMQALTEILRQAKAIYILHLLISHDGVVIASYIPSLLPFVELICFTFADAYGILAKKKLQTFILNHQAFVADIYLIYNFSAMLMMQILLSAVIVGLMNFIIGELTADPAIKEYTIYYIISIASAPLTSALANYVEIIMDAEKEKFLCCLVKIIDPVITIIGFSIFQIMKSKETKGTTTYIALSLICAFAQFVSCAHQLRQLWKKKNNKLPMRMKFQSFKPFRGAFLGKQLYQEIPYVFQCAGEPLMFLLIQILIQKDYNTQLAYPDAAIAVFYYIRYLTKIGQSLQYSAKRFLDLYINANQQINANHRIYTILFKGLFIHLALNLAITGIVYWLAIPIANLVYTLDKLNQYQAQTYSMLIDESTMAALCIFANIVTPFTQSMIYNYHNKFTNCIEGIIAGLEWICIALCLVLYYTSKQTYLIYNYYTMYHLVVGICNTAFYPIIMIKFKRHADESGADEIPTIDELTGKVIEQPRKEEQNEKPILRLQTRNIGDVLPQKSTDVIQEGNISMIMPKKLDLDELFGIPEDSKPFIPSSHSNNNSGRDNTGLSKLINEIDLDHDFVLKPLSAENVQKKSE